MQRAHDAGDWNACVIKAIHCAIAAADALSVYSLGFRHSGERHEDAIELFRSIQANDAEIRSNARRLGGLLGIKTAAEYEERLQRRSDADRALRDAQRLLSFVNSRLPKKEPGS